MNRRAQLVGTRPETRILSSRQSVWGGLASLLAYRELLLTWTLRELRGRYRQSALGVAWTLVTPVVQMLVITIVFGRFLGVSSSTAVPYPIFTFVAILPWTFFSGALGSAIPSILGNMALVTKIYFPREILPLSAILSRLVDFAASGLVLLALLFWYEIPPSTSWLLLPVVLLIQITLTFGLALLGATVSVFLRDIAFAIPLIMQLWMYASPVIYPVSNVPSSLQPLYMLNPMSSIITAYRAILLESGLPSVGYLAYSGAAALFSVAVGYWYFKRLEMSMADII